MAFPHFLLIYYVGMWAWDTRNIMRCREFWVQFYGSKCVICRYVLKGQVKLFTHQLLTEFLLIAEDPRLCMEMKSLLSWNLLSAASNKALDKQMPPAPPVGDDSQREGWARPEAAFGCGDRETCLLWSVPQREDCGDFSSVCGSQVATGQG